MKFEGICPAVLTPFDENDKVNYDAIGQLVDRLIDQGIGGLFVCGSTGEWWTLTQEERMKVTETAIRAADGRVKTMVHVGSTCTRFAVQLAEHAEKVGADAISALPPVGSVHNAREVWDYFKSVGDSCSLPLYLYHLPQTHGSIITVDKFIEALDTMPTLAGAKFSSYRVDDLIHVRIKAKGRLNILSGCGEQLLSGTACGADGSICTWYNLIPRLANKIHDCVLSSDIEGARKHEDILVDFAMHCIHNAIGNLKYLVTLRGIDVGRPRLPRPYPTPAEQEALLANLKPTGILDWCI